jgi:hypothetical protein
METDVLMLGVADWNHQMLAKIVYVDDISRHNVTIQAMSSKLWATVVVTC